MLLDQVAALAETHPDRVGALVEHPLFGAAVRGTEGASEAIIQDLGFHDMGATYSRVVIMAAGMFIRSLSVETTEQGIEQFKERIGLI